MTDTRTNLFELLGSRICHDLISPIGAINNGLELLSMTAQSAASPELVLIQESCRSASARIRFFRVAFGVASPSQRMGPGELRNILQDFNMGSRNSVNWVPDTDTSRRDAQLAFLGLLCLESALPFGGSIRVDESAGRWKLTATADTIRIAHEIWDELPSGTLDAALEPALVHFCLLRDLAQERDRPLEVTLGETQIQMLV